MKPFDTECTVSKLQHTVSAPNAVSIKNLSTFVNKSSMAEAKQISNPVAKFFSKHNIPFNKIDSYEFNSMIKSLPPTYE